MIHLTIFVIKTDTTSIRISSRWVCYCQIRTRVEQHTTIRVTQFCHIWLAISKGRCKYTHTHSLTHTHSHSHTLTHIHTHTHTHSHTHTHAHTHSHACTRTLTHSLTHSHSHTLTHSHVYVRKVYTRTRISRTTNIYISTAIKPNPYCISFNISVIVTA
jgi:hypothetical protein